MCQTLPRPLVATTSGMKKRPLGGNPRGLRTQSRCQDRLTRRHHHAIERSRQGVFAAGLEKSTVGAVRAPGVVTSKYSRGFAPVTFAVNDCGRVLMYVLYV